MNDLPLSKWSHSSKIKRAGMMILEVVLFATAITGLILLLNQIQKYQPRKIRHEFRTFRDERDALIKSDQ